MTIRPNQFSWRCKFTKCDCDTAGNVYYSSVFRITEVAREQFFLEYVEGYPDLVRGGLEVMIADAQFKFHSEFLPFDKADCVATVTEIVETEVTFHFQFLELDSGATCAEATQTIRFADANHNPKDVPVAVKRALAALPAR